MTARTLAPRPDQAPLWRPLDWLVRPLDRVRRWTWALSAKTAFGRACVSDRPLRLTTLALGHMAVALTLTLIAPVWMLLLGPLVLGVPHVASDVRYLLVHPPLPLGRRGLVLLRARAAHGDDRSARVGGGARRALPRVVLGWPWRGRDAGRRRHRRGAAREEGDRRVHRRRAHDAGAGRAVAHARRLRPRAQPCRVRTVALALPRRSLARRPRAHRRRLRRGRRVPHERGLRALRRARARLRHRPLGLVDLGTTLAPGLDFELGLRLVAVYAFAQAMHYVVWLRLIPQRLDVRAAPPTIRRARSAACASTSGASASPYWWSRRWRRRSLRSPSTPWTYAASTCSRPSRTAGLSWRSSRRCSRAVAGRRTGWGHA